MYFNKMKSNTTYKLSKINDSKFILHHHLGLGDHIICNGMVNYLTNYFNKIYIPVKEKNFDNIKYLYKDKKSVIPFSIKRLNAETEKIEIDEFSKKNNLKILKVGFDKISKPFNLGFYKQVGIPFSYSFDYFSIPNNFQAQKLLSESMKKHFNIKNDYTLIHNESSMGDLDLDLDLDFKPIYIKKELDPYKNIFLYRDLIENAKEIHCIDSSFLHLVERLKTSSKLFFHNAKKIGIKGEKVELLKDWNVVEYYV